MPFKGHAPTGKTLIGAGGHHHGLGDGDACISREHLVLLLLPSVDRQAIVKLRKIVIQIWLADLGLNREDA